ncbi:ATP-dependent nuclease [Anaerotignum propionicum]|uniref:ATP-dependent nuclease n=1 Tax=Anaerotignum propionicum TaxID=28446 RepID=UPI00289F8D97|nr:AAA family ATPase [Anaerotignum propionicum]
MSIQKIHISNFTVFKDIDITFSNGCNLFIGENATGKTQLLKMLNDNHINRQISFLMDFEIESSGGEKITYIPVKDMLTHAKGFISMSEKYREFPFGKELIDIIKKSEQWQLKKIPDIAKNILSKLEMMMEGKVLYENEEFYIQKKNGEKVSFEHEAEGYKKIGLLWQLIMTENITENSVLLWDEPEANLNPKYIPDLVEIILELSRNGVQIFLTTHSYIFAKYFEVRRRNSDKILFHSLYKTENKGVLCESNPNFKDLKHNTISKSFEKLLDEVYDLNAGE